MRRKRKSIVKIGRLLNLKRFICKKTQFVIDALFDSYFNHHNDRV